MLKPGHSVHVMTYSSSAGVGLGAHTDKLHAQCTKERCNASSHLQSITPLKLRIVAASWRAQAARRRSQLALTFGWLSFASVVNESERQVVTWHYMTKNVCRLPVHLRTSPLQPISSLTGDPGKDNANVGPGSLGHLCWRAQQHAAHSEASKCVLNAKNVFEMTRCDSEGT